MKSLIALMILALAPSLAQGAPSAWNDRAFWKDAVRNNIQFFDRNAWDESSGSYATDLDREGKKLSDNRASVALGRMVYANALAPDELRDLPRARRSAEFILNHMVVRDGHGIRFLFSVDSQGRPTEDRPYTFIFEQSYPIAGLVALYQADPRANADLLPVVREAARSYWSRFHDAEHGGLFYYYNTARGDHSNDQGQVHKSYQSTIYPVSSFLLALRDADPSGRATYDAWIRELLDVAARHLVERAPDGPATGWLRERFDAAWGVDDTYRMTEAGHITQLAWVLDVAAAKGILAGADAAEARALSLRLLTRLVDRGGISPTGAVYDAFDRVTGKPWVDGLSNGGRATSAWWSTLESVIAFSRLAPRDARFDSVLDGLARAYSSYFYDHEQGGEIFRIDSATGAVVDGTKGGPGKSGYHILETYRYLFE